MTHLPEGLERTLLAAPQAVTNRVEVYSGIARISGTVWAAEVRLAGQQPDTAVLITHPSANGLAHYALAPLAARGLAAVGMMTRYVGNDSNVRTENCLLDIASVVKLLRERGYSKIALVGNSGGASLAPYYQAQAANPTITSPPGGGPDLTKADLPEVDAVCLLNAHSGRPRLLTEWLDPAIYDEHRPFDRDSSLDMYDKRNGPPYPPEFLERYRAAQVERNHRITRWSEAVLADLEVNGPAGLDDLPFTVYGTYADPLILDGSLEPDDRLVGTSLWGAPTATNHFPAALGRFTTTRSWINQWSLKYALGDSLRWLPELTVPVHVIYGTADSAAHPRHSIDMYNAITSPSRKVTALEGASHYFLDQPEHLEHAMDVLGTWAKELT